MAAAAHLLRRNAVYYWRRKVPIKLVDRQNRTHLLISLRTWSPTQARSLAVQLDAFLDDLMTMPEARFLTQAQLDGMLRDVLTRHLAKLERVAAVAKLEPGFDRRQAEQDDRRAAWVYRLLDAQGPNAHVSDSDRDAILADGFGQNDLKSIIDHLARLQDDGLVPTKPHILRPLLEAQNAEPTATNLAQAQQVYLRGMRLALQQTAARYRAQPIDDEAFVVGLIRAEAGARAALAAAGAPLRMGRSEASRDPSAEPHVAVGAAPAAAPEPAPFDDRISILGDQLRRKRTKEKAWDEKTARQATRLYALFERYLAEQCGIAGLQALRQPHLARFINFLEFEVYKHYGKSVRDERRTIAELLKIAAGQPAEKRGVEAPTLNRHLTFLNQLLDYARSQGARLDADLSTTRLRARNTKADRARNARAALETDAATRVFVLPPFTGCRSWEEPLEPGDAVYHRALYFVPLMLYYQGGRREEFCGLEVDDVIVDNGPHPYLHLAPTSVRRLKNPQSQRNSPLHPEVLRLNFLAYVAAIKALGYKRLFPDLHSPSTRSPMGDRFYREFKPALSAADTDEEGFVIHSLRHGFGDALKQKGATEEERGDLLGHAGKSETSERYCKAYEIQILYDLVCKVPDVTSGLSPQPLLLLPWVQEKRIAPFSRKARRGRNLPR
jgi:integrase